MAIPNIGLDVFFVQSEHIQHITKQQFIKFHLRSSNQCFRHIETIQLLFITNQKSDFYMNMKGNWLLIF